MTEFAVLVIAILIGTAFHLWRRAVHRRRIAASPFRYWCVDKGPISSGF